LKRQERNKRVIGIDPGSIYCGYGIIDRTDKDGTEYVISGRIELNKREPLHTRLRELYSGLIEIIREFRPHEAAIEKVFFAKGIKAALHLGHARGIALLAASTENLEIFEYSALEVKKSVVGYGRAEKSQVASMVTGILNLRKKISDDSADALALALCHLNSIDITSMISRM
jgi:crossover junction endodeoxyribonuclease RuvC